MSSVSASSRNVFHELVSPDIHVDICVVPPLRSGTYCTLVTMGMGAHRMNAGGNWRNISWSGRSWPLPCLRTGSWIRSP